MLRPCDNFSYTIRLRIFCPGLFRRGLIVTVTICPAQAILLVTSRPAWWSDTIAACKVVRMRWPNLARGMIDPTYSKKTPLTRAEVEFCLVGLAIFGVRLGQACARLTHTWMKFSRVAQRRILTAPSVCCRPNCPPPPAGWRREWVWLYMGQVVTANI
jgi:hypothetical protein